MEIKLRRLTSALRPAEGGILIRNQLGNEIKKEPVGNALISGDSSTACQETAERTYLIILGKLSICFEESIFHVTLFLSIFFRYVKKEDCGE